MIYNGSDLKNISFPLGGIGTGCIGLAGNGELIDWEIFNRPSKNTKNGYSHFSVSARTKNDTVSRVLHSDTFENLSGVHEVGRHKGFGYGVRNSTLAGFPHFKDIAFDGSFPMARLSFIDDEFPAGITLTAFNPLIPHNAYDSSLPVAFFEWNIENTTDGVVEYSVALSARNPSSASRNEELNDTCGFTGIKLYTAEEKSTATSYFDITVLTDSKDSVAQEYWYRGGWMDSVTMYWNNFTKLDRMPKRHYDTVGNLDHCTLASYITLQPHSSGKVRFVIAWNAPNQYNYWSPCLDENGEHKP